jgi:FkbM family methyltransferase
MVGTLIRLPLRLIPRGFIVRILSGPLRGYRWIVGAGVHEVWIGTYERAKVSRVQASLKPGDVFYDVGAHAGIYSLAAARAVGERGTIVAIEPNPINGAHFARHMELNQIKSVRLLAAAASDTVGSATFSHGPNSYEGRLQPQGQLAVETIRLDDIQPAPSVMKIDVEGHEVNVLRGAEHILDRNRPTVFVATHDPQSRAQCIQILEAHDYQVRWLDANDLFASPN